jgi:hypothetical protein
MQPQRIMVESCVRSSKQPAAAEAPEQFPAEANAACSSDGLHMHMRMLMRQAQRWFVHPECTTFAIERVACAQQLLLQQWQCWFWGLSLAPGCRCNSGCSVVASVVQHAAQQGRRRFKQWISSVISSLLSMVDTM